MGVLISHSAYGASYVNVSSGGSGETAGVVSLGKIKPSSSGSTATGNDTLTVHTDCSAGYKVYVSGQNGKTTNLINQSTTDPSNPSSSDIISASSGTIASPAVLSANTWGISGNSTDIENHLYAGLPAYSSATNASLVTKSDVAEESTVPIYYGVKADTTLNPGTYSGDILYTVLMDTSCIPYTVEFSPNVEQSSESEITGEMTAQSILPNSATALTANAYEREGYTFLGWSTTPEGKTGNVTNGIGTADDVDYDDEAEVTNLTTGGSSITLYVIWEVAPTEYMQDFMCSRLSPNGETKTLVDKRDGQEYTVYRIPTDNAATNVAGKCIMTKDLNLGAVNSVTGSSSTITANGTMTLSPEDSTFSTPTGSGESIAVPTSNVTVSMTWNTSDSYSNRHYHTNGTGDYAGRGYYSWGAAMVACPKGWRLPTSDELNNNGSLNSSTTGISKAVNNSLSTLQSSPWSFVLGGYYSNGFDNAGSGGYYWSSTQRDSMDSYSLRLYSSDSLVRNFSGKEFGFAVRCMADDYDNTMQDFDSSSLSEGETMKLKDKRDDAIYTVKKFSDGTVWMTENLILGHDKGYALTSELTNIPSNDDGTLSNNGTYYLPAAGRRGAFNNSTYFGTSTFDSNNGNQAQVQYRAAGSTGDKSSSGTLGQSTGYYNFWAASLGYSGYSGYGSSSGNTPRDICPKGWQLPLGGNNTGSKSWYYFYNTLNGGSHSNMVSASGAGFLYSGNYYSSQLYGVGSYGNWWSSTVDNTSNSYTLGLNSSGGVYPQGDSNKYNGFAVRCVAQDVATITFDANGGTGEMSSQKLYENDATLKSNTFTRDGYTFLGWSEDANATTATYADGASVSDLVSRGGNITLYAIWEEIQDMQGWLGCGKMSVGDIKRLKDTRDNKVYAVKKLPDGKCWMIENLTISATGMAVDALDNTNTNIPSSDTNKYYLPPQNMRNAIGNSITSSATKTANAVAYFDTGYGNQPQVGYRAAGTTDNYTDRAIPENTAYYNFYTASLGFSYDQDGKTSGSTPRDICPKGWRLPFVSDNGTSITAASSEFANLARSYNGSASWTGSNGGATDYNYYTSDSTIRKNMVAGDSGSLDRFASNGAAGFTYAGHYSSTTLYDVGTHGLYWSSSVYDTNYSYLLRFGITDVSPQNYSNKNIGHAVRCVTESVDGTMQSFDSSSLTNVGDMAKLKDIRDNKVYTVKKLPDGKVWMIDNLTISATGMVADSLDNTNTNIPSSDTNKYYLPPQNMRSGLTNSITSSATKTASVAAYFNTSYSNQPQVGYRAAGTTNNNTGNAVPENTAYYNFYTASLGFSYQNDGKTSGSSPRDICPKGWRLPWSNDYGTASGNSYHYNGSAELYKLALAYNGTSSVWSNYITPTSTGSNSPSTSNATVRQNMVAGDSGSLDRFASNGAAGFTYAGYYNGTTSYSVGTNGFYWSSSVYNTNYSYNLYFDTTDVNPQTYTNKYYGLAVRCIAGTRS